MTNYDFYQAQDPNQAYTRWLAEQQGGRPFSSPVRQLLEARGRRQAEFARLAGYGIGQDIGGQGKDYAPFYSERQRQTPLWGDVQRQLQEAQAAVNSGDKVTPYQLGLAANYQTQASQLEALQAGLGTQFPAALRGGLSRVLGRRFKDQQAVSSSQSFFDYASEKGWF